MRRPRKATPLTPRTPKTIKVVLVKWEDATHQEDDTEKIGTMLAWTVGFQLHRTKKEVALCMEFFQNGGKRDITAIPMLNVKKIVTLTAIPFTISDE